MAGRRLMTLDARELIRRLRAGQSQREIARDLSIDRKTVRKYRRFAMKRGYLEGALPGAGELDLKLEESSGTGGLPEGVFKAAAYREAIEDLRGKGVEGKAIWQRLIEEHGYGGSYSSVYRYLRRLEEREPEGFVRLEAAPGAEAQVDFGYAGRMREPASGRERRAWAFVMTLSCSRHQYARLVFDQSVSTWLWCHRLAFEFFGGVPAKVVIDNLKAGIVKALWRDQVVQRCYRDFAEHYGVLISPCRPGTPEHKGKVESGVRYLKRNFLAGREIVDIRDGNEKLMEWIMRTAGMRIHGTTRKRPLEVFDGLEREALRPLPAAAFDMGVWKSVRLHRDCHVVVDGAYYSAPHRLIGRQLWARTNGREIEIYHEYTRVATHAWARPGERRTILAHYPPGKTRYLEETPEVCRRRAAEIGEHTASVVDRLLGERPLDRLTTAQAILRLAARYGPPRLERACARALWFGELHYGSIKRMLEKGLDLEPVAEERAVIHTAARPVFARAVGEIFPAPEREVNHGRH
jgi:transposase